MQTLRAVFILSGFLGFTLALIPVQMILLAASREGARKLPHWYHRQVCRMLGIRLRCHGVVASDRPVLLISNHISWLDIPVLSAIAPVSFVAKKEVGSWPGVSILARLQRTVYVDRERRRDVQPASNQIAARMREGDNIVLFPEGTSSDGNRVLPFRSALFGAVKPGRANDGHSEVYVQTAAIAYTRVHGVPLGRQGRPLVAWYGDMDMLSHAWRVLKSGPLDVEVRLGAPQTLESFENRKALAAFSERQVRRDMGELLRPLAA